MVTLVVGKNKPPFHVHIDLLSEVSPFFKSAFQGAGTFKETSERLMTLPEDRSSTIERMVHWLYSKNIPYDRKPLVTQESDHDQEVILRNGYKQLVMLYITADKFGIIALKNDIIDILYELQTDQAFVLMESIIHYVYRNTPAGSSLRRLIVDWHVWQADPSWVEGTSSQENLRRCPDFAAEMVTRMIAKECGRQDPWTEPSSKFHEAAEGIAEGNSDDSESYSSNQSSGMSICSEHSSIGDENSSGM